MTVIRVLLLTVALSSLVLGDISVYMDSPVACGRTYSVGDLEVYVVKPRGSVGVSNPPTSCTTVFESSHSSSNYMFQVVVEMAQFNDCSMTLNVYEGASVGGNYKRVLGCGTTDSTSHIYPKGRSFTLQLTRTRDQYVYGNDFQLRVQLYYDADGPDEITGSSQFPVAGIVGVVLGTIVFIAAFILLAWCYKSGRLPGMDPYSYPNVSNKTSMENLSKSGIDNNGGGGPFVSWHNTEGKSVTTDTRSNFDLSDSRVWESLTSVNATVPRKDNIKSLNVPPPTVPIAAKRGLGRDSRFNREDTKQLSNSPGTRVRGKGRDFNNDKRDNSVSDYEVSETMIKHPEGHRNNFTSFKGNDRDRNRNSGVFVNPDKEGYMYDYDQVKQLEGDDREKGKTQDFASELQAAIRKASIKRQKSENQADSDGVGAQSSEGVSDSVFNSTSAIDKQTDKDTSGPEAQSSPKPKKKRKNSKERKSPKSSRKQKGDESPKKSPRSKARKSLNLDNNDDDDASVPPEAYAPIFSGDEEPSTSMEYSHQYQPGYQGHVPGAPFDPRYPMGAYQPGMYPPGMYPPGMPYQQAGQAQWYVEANPNGQHKMAFAMQTHSQSDDSLQGGGPGYSSTPYAPARYTKGNDSALVPAGTILDDPQVPKPGTSLMRYDEDPLTGMKTSQVIWTDAKRDPTDPPPDSSTQITRKTITRITTKSTDNQLTEAPNPTLQDMSWRSAQQIQATGGQEPAFMSPTRGAPYPSAIQYATETPERTNASYYMGSQHLPPNLEY